MIFPRYLNTGDGIGVTAMSHPIDKDVDQARFQNAKRQLKEKGYVVTFTDNVFVPADRYGRSSTGEEKARQFHELLSDDRIAAIYSASGGDFLAEMLPYVNLGLFRQHPKWVQGYSDNTSILYYLTTKADIATAYGANFGDFGMEPWDDGVIRGLGVLEGTATLQESFPSYQNGFGERITGLEGYTADSQVEWKCITSPNHGCEMQGRLLGGCMDVLLNLAGTPYDGTLEFIEKYKEDGILWYLESFDLHFEQMMEGLWKMKEMGWFAHAAGFIFGRPLFYPEQGFDGTPLPTYEEVLLERLADLDVPIITGADIGHKGPQFVMINGAVAKASCSNGKGRVEFLVSR